MKARGSIFVLLAIEVFCLISYFLHNPLEISELENRTLMTFDMVINNPPDEDSIVYKETPSERFEEALKDQFFGRDWITLHYADYTALLENTFAKGRDVIMTAFVKDNDYDTAGGAIEIDYDEWPGYGLPRLESIPHQNYSFAKIGNLFRFNGTEYIFDRPIFDPPDSVQIEAHANQIEHIHELYPDISFYSYFVSPLSGSKWFDRQMGYDTPDYFEVIAQGMPEYMKVKRLVYQDDTDYEKMFYKSDHHWCYNGFTQGYLDICNMISEDYDISAAKMTRPPQRRHVKRKGLSPLAVLVDFAALSPPGSHCTRLCTG